METVELDGGAGEGGGQVLRSALALSVLFQKPVKISNIRRKRPKPGLQAQHLAGVTTLAKLCRGSVFGAALHSTTLEFFPGRPQSANLDVHIGTAGAVSLLVQQLAPVALFCPVQLRVFGGTDVPFSPPAGFVSRVWLPAVKAMGCRFEFEVMARGYFPAGGGRVVFKSKAAHWPLRALSASPTVGELKAVEIVGHGRSLPSSVFAEALLHARRSIEKRFPGADIVSRFESGSGDAAYRGFGLDIFGEFDSGARAFSHALSEKNRPVESVSALCVRRFDESVKDRAPVDIHLADQLLLFAALAKGITRLDVARVSDHVKSNAEIIRAFIPGVSIEFESSASSPLSSIVVQGIAYTGSAMESQPENAMDASTPANKNGPNGGNRR